jgi:hypothetical protein
MASLPVSGLALRIGHRLRMRLGESFEPLADLLGLQPRTLAHVETWSGPTAAAMLLLAEAPAARVPSLAETLLLVHGRSASAVVASLAAEVRDASPRMTFAEALDRPVEWVYWATSARADPEETLRLAAEEGIVCRPLLENVDEVHGYLYAVRPGDRVLLTHDGTPLSWLEVVEGDEPPPRLWSLEHTTLKRGAPNLATLLPHVFRFVPLASRLGTRLASGDHPYKLFDGQPVGRKQSGWFSALAVRIVQHKLPRAADFAGRGRGHRSRMTRYRRSLEAAEP